MGFQAPLSFLNGYDFRRGVTQALKDDQGAAKLFVLEASGIVEIDFTAASILTGVIATTRKAGVDFAVARLESVRAQQAFDRFGITQHLGADHIFESVAEAIKSLAPG